MRKILRIILICAFVAVPAWADPNPTTDPTMIGGPFVGDSWGFTISVPWNSDLYAVRISPGYEATDSFESPAIRNVTLPGWSMVLDGPSLASAQGFGPLGNPDWDVLFAGDAPPALIEIDNVWFNGQTKVGETHWVLANGSYLSSEGGSWRHSNDWNPTRAEVVPVPGAVLLGILGLSAVGVKLHKYA